MWISVVTFAAIGWICALYLWQAYEFRNDRKRPPEQPRPMEHAGWDSLLGLKTSEFERPS